MHDIIMQETIRDLLVVGSVGLIGELRSVFVRGFSLGRFPSMNTFLSSSEGRSDSLNLGVHKWAVRVNLQRRAGRAISSST